MFDRFNLGGGHHTHTHSHTVHEHRAPTDKSVALLKEMEQAALDKLLASVCLDACGLSAFAHFFNDQMGHRVRCIIEWQAPGKRIRLDHSIAMTGETDHEFLQRMADELRAKLAESIAIELLREPFDALVRSKEFSRGRA